MSAHCIIFDLDGTLVDSLADLGESVNSVLGERGLPTHPLDAYRKFVGDGIVVLVRRALGDASASTKLVDDCVARVRAVYGGRWDLKTRPYPGVVPAVAQLRELGCMLAVLSNKPHPMTTVIVSRFFPEGSFHAVLGAEMGYARKPNPSGALELAARCGVAPARCLYVGDTATDMETASRAGMQSIGALWGFRDAAELKAAGASVLVARPSDLVEVLGDRMRATGPI